MEALLVTNATSSSNTTTPTPAYTPSQLLTTSLIVGYILLGLSALLLVGIFVVAVSKSYARRRLRRRARRDQMLEMASVNDRVSPPRLVPLDNDVS